MNANALRLLLAQQGIDEAALSNMPMSGRMTAEGEELSIGGALPERRNALAQMMQGPDLITYEQFKEQGPARGEGYMETSDGRRITFGRKVSDAPMQQRESRQPSEGENVNFSRPININGRRGYYGNDGFSAYLPKPEGGYDVMQFDTRTPQEIYANEARQLENEGRRAQIDATRENILRSQTERTRKEIPQEKWATDLARGVQINERTGEARPIMMDGQPLLNREASKLEAKASEKDKALQSTLELYESAKEGLVSGLSSTTTGPLMGRLPAFTTGQQVAQGSVAAMAPVLKQLFRVAGEGVFTDKDQQLLLEMIPTRETNPEARAVMLNNIDNIVRAKIGLTRPPKSSAPQGAVEMLRANPGLAQQFDAKYGQGAAARALQ